MVVVRSVKVPLGQQLVTHAGRPRRLKKAERMNLKRATGVRNAHIRISGPFHRICVVVVPVMNENW
jgi:hypothetical protein